MNTTKLAALAAAGLTAAALAACDTTAAAPEVTSTAAVEPISATTGAWNAEPDDTAATATGRSEKIYVLALDLNGVYYATEGQAVAAGETICSRLDGGENLSGVMMNYAITETPINAGVTTDGTGAIAGAAISSFCPEYQDQLDAFIAMWGGRQ